MALYDRQLQQYFAKYMYVDAAKRDCIAMLSGYSDLRPTMEDYTFNNGETKKLVALNGTIPVHHKGATYNIPIAVYLLEKHPYDPPLVYVKPTPAMEIRQSQIVDSNGKIYLPYLTNWRHPQSDLAGLVQLLQFQFGEVPPVVSRSNRQQQQQPAQQQYGWASGYGWNSSSGTRPDFNDETLRMSLVSALDEKIRRKYRERRAQLQAELDVVQRTGDDLRTGKSKLESLLSGLDTEIGHLETHLVTVRERNSELETSIVQVQQQGQLSVDDSLDASTPLYRQIVNAYAEEQALDDSIYQLGDLLRNNSIQVDVYLKSVRELSRRQFFLRATVQQGRLKAGLPEL